ncbi:MAG TPA: aminodeoxychorismate synthase component I [Pyrinomonadaceae bacterium]|nr:aminodeoxychorismate synthase component I [Pyrinomonadaceae bacterium]
MIAGIRPTETFEVSSGNPDEVLQVIDQKLSGNLAAIFTLSYDFGAKMQRVRRSGTSDEPDAFLALFETLIVHDYDSGRTLIVGDDAKFDVQLSFESSDPEPQPDIESGEYRSNFSREDYISAVETIRDFIRRGDTYQTNLTQQLTARSNLEPSEIFLRLRRNHPAPFAAFIQRKSSTVVSASPERFFSIDRNEDIEASPIKGTRRRGSTVTDDDRLRAELISSEKDRAENIMIVDLVRNDLGRVCEFGSVAVEKLCDLEEHPTLFHLVSTVHGKLRHGTSFSDVLRATFPCGSITGAPKIRTMQLINEIEPAHRELSMGAIGMYVPSGWDLGDVDFNAVYDLSVAIRTMVIRGDVVKFSVGGGIVIDSDPSDEYDESLLKASALLASLIADARDST